jgi:hypothetical protein
MKNPCPCAKKTKRKSSTKNKKMSVPKAAYNKFAGVRAPILANTSGTFTMPGFAPIKSFPFPGLVTGNASQIDGLLPGSGRADMIAANIYRVQDRRDDVASGLGVTGLNSAPKGNVSGRKINLTNPNVSIIPNTTVYDSFSDNSFTPRKSTPRRDSMPTLELSPSPGLGFLSPIKQEHQEEKARQQGMRAAHFERYNPGAGNSKETPLNVPDGTGALTRAPSTRQKTTVTIFSPS